SQTGTRNNSVWFRGLFDATRLHIDGGFRILRNVALSATGSHDEHHAAGPRRQHVRERNEFQEERREQERMKAEQSRHRDHGDSVEYFIDAGPSKRPEEKLRDIDGDREGICHADAGPRDTRWRLHSYEPALYGCEQFS